jgi:hypothetical protein
MTFLLDPFRVPWLLGQRSEPFLICHVPHRGQKHGMRPQGRRSETNRGLLSENTLSAVSERTHNHRWHLLSESIFQKIDKGRQDIGGNQGE